MAPRAAASSNASASLPPPPRSPAASEASVEDLGVRQAPVVAADGGAGYTFGPITDEALAADNLSAEVVPNAGAGQCFYLALASFAPGTMAIADKATQLRVGIAEHYRAMRDTPPFPASASREQQVVATAAHMPTSPSCGR